MRSSSCASHTGAMRTDPDDHPLPGSRGRNCVTPPLKPECFPSGYRGRVSAEGPVPDLGEIDRTRAALDAVIPKEHWRNVGRVAVHAAWLEEAAALIRYASEGCWDMTYNHLRFASSKQGLLRSLRKLVQELPDAETRTAVPGAGEVRVERSEVKRRLCEFIERTQSLLERRDRVVHSVPWQNWFSGAVQGVHPRSLRDNAAHARGPLPTTGECEVLVDDLVSAAQEAQWLAPRIGALLASR